MKTRGEVKVYRRADCLHLTYFHFVVYMTFVQITKLGPNNYQRKMLITEPTSLALHYRNVTSINYVASEIWPKYIKRPPAEWWNKNIASFLHAWCASFYTL